MVKKKTVRQKVKEKTSKQTQKSVPTDSTIKDEDGPELATPRMQRKVVKQMRFLERLQRTQQSLTPTKSIGKKKRKGAARNVGLALSTLPELAGVLPSLAEPAKAVKSGLRQLPKVVRNKARKRITTDETKQFAAVIAHPAFKADPLAAIKQHLLNTLPSPPPQTQTAGRPANKGKRKKPKQKYTGEEPIKSTHQMDTS